MLSAISTRARELRRRVQFATARPHEVTQFPSGDTVEFDHLVCVEDLNGMLVGPHIVVSVHGGRTRAWRAAEALWSTHASRVFRCVVYQHRHHSCLLGITAPNTSAIVGWLDLEGRHDTGPTGKP